MKKIIVLLLFLVLAVSAYADDTATETASEYDSEKFDSKDFFKKELKQEFPSLDIHEVAKNALIGKKISDDMSKIVKAISKSIDWKTPASTNCRMAAKVDADLTMIQMEDTSILREIGHSVYDLFKDTLTLGFGKNFMDYGAEKTIDEIAEEKAKELAKKIPEEYLKSIPDPKKGVEVFIHDPLLWEYEGCDRYSETMWLKEEGKVMMYLKADCHCNELKKNPQGKPSEKVRSYLLTVEADAPTDGQGKLIGVSNIRYSLSANCDCDDEDEVSDQYCELPEKEEDKEEITVAEKEIKTSVVRNAKALVDEYKGLGFTQVLKIYSAVKRATPPCSESVKEDALERIRKVRYEIQEDGIKKLGSALEMVSENPGISDREKQVMAEYLKKLIEIDKKLEKDVEWINGFWKCHCPKKISCDMESLLERDLRIPAQLAQSYAHEKVNLQCGMWKIVSISTTIGPKGSTTDVKVDDSSVHAYGIMFDEEGKISDQIIDGGWDDPDLEVYLDNGTLNDINSAEDPTAKLLEEWGKSIKFKGKTAKSQAKTGLLNLANNIKNKLPAAKPALGWQMPKIPSPKLPKPSTLGQIPLQLGKFTLNKLGLAKKPEPKPEAKCTIRGIPYNCYRGTLSLAPRSVQRGSTVEVEASGFSFSGSVTLLAESISGGKTMMKIKGAKVNSNTYSFKAAIPSGKYKISVVVEKGAVDDFADSSDTLTVYSAGVPSRVPGKLGESCDNRKCAPGLFCGAPYTWGGGLRQAPNYGYICKDLKEYSTLCIGKGNSPPAWKCI